MKWMEILNVIQKEKEKYFAEVDAFNVLDGKPKLSDEAKADLSLVLDGKLSKKKKKEYLKRAAVSCGKFSNV